MIRASIDLGTNTCLLLIVEWDSKKKRVKKIISDQSTVVRLGEGVDQHKELQAAPMKRVYQCLTSYAEKLKGVGVLPSEVICVATSQARDAKNSTAFFSEIQTQLGFSFKVISGEKEARLTFQGALPDSVQPKNALVIDIGGGSTEIITAQGEKSLDIGSVRFSERYLKSNPVKDDEFWACQDAIDSVLNDLVPWVKGQRDAREVVAVAGTATTLAAWYLELSEFDSNKVDQCVLTRGDVHRMVEELKWRTVEERRALPCMDPGRADVLLAGALILWRTLEVLGFQHCKISSRGLRFGVLLSGD